MIIYQTLTQDNREQYTENVLSRLNKGDNFGADTPVSSSVYAVKSTFARCNAVLAVDSSTGNVIGFIAYTNYGLHITLDLIMCGGEVGRIHVGRQLIAYLEQIKRNTPLALLKIKAAPGYEEELVRTDNWRDHGNIDGNMYKLTTFTKIVTELGRPAPALRDLPPKGLVFALCNKECYSVQREPESFKIKYYPVEVDRVESVVEPKQDDGEEGDDIPPPVINRYVLKKPLVVTRFNFDGYVALHYNNSLVCSGKVKHLFQRDYNTAGGATVEVDCFLCNAIVPNQTHHELVSFLENTFI